VGNLPPDPSANHRLFDRIVNVRDAYTVPLGLKGTIIGKICTWHSNKWVEFVWNPGCDWSFSVSAVSLGLIFKKHSCVWFFCFCRLQSYGMWHCNLVKICYCFSGTCCLYLHGWICCGNQALNTLWHRVVKPLCYVCSCGPVHTGLIFCIPSQVWWIFSVVALQNVIYILY
jgi:hypothetical protein